MDGHRLFRYSSVAALALCWVTIILGGNVIASGSGLGCSSWPSCNGSYFPPLTGAEGIEWIHRLSALFLSIAILILTIAALAYERQRPALIRLSIAALALVVVLALLGAAVVDSSLDISLVLLHFGVATILFGILLILALLSNWRFIPRNWMSWAQRAVEPNVEGRSGPGAADPSSPGAIRPDPAPAGQS